MLHALSPHRMSREEAKRKKKTSNRVVNSLTVLACVGACDVVLYINGWRRLICGGAQCGGSSIVLG